ncbi:DUF6681 family protein [Limosilactobacillus viscerum]|uniref:DUF6681 family protein n=1 Tax=Limosilactobacillus viscerum TaxID=2993450 RepID=UPI0024B9EFEA|nr:DUF6681 family protein [Limosilactobacillus viscerum]
MFSFLDMINSSLSYFNLDVKLKSRIYIGIAAAGDIYLVYVTFRLFANHVWLRGFLYCLAMVAITYFLYLNFVYYFLGKTSRFDFISPKFAKITGQHFDSAGNKTSTRASRRAAALANQSNGLFTGNNTIPAAVAIDDYEQRNLQRVVDQLLTEGIFTNDFDGMDDDQIIDQYNETGKPVQALNAESVPPYFELVHDKLRHRLEIYIGLNQMERRAVGHITRIGLTDVRDAHQKYRIYLAGLVVTAGPNKIPGRRGSTIMTTADYGLNAQVAYREREHEK